MNVWLIEDQWWRPDEEVRRRYSELLLEGDVRLVLYQDVVSGAWYQQQGAVAPSMADRRWVAVQPP